MELRELQVNTFPPYYQVYLDQLPNDKLLSLLELQKLEMLNLLNGLNAEQLLSTYAPGKWTVAQVIQHMIDTERIFQYRSLVIARGDTTALPGYDQDAYVPISKANTRSLNDFLQEYSSVREAGIYLFKSFSTEMLQYEGTSNGHVLSAAAAGFIIAGHEKHHIKLFQTKYQL